MKKNVSGQVIGAQMITISDGSDFTGTVSVDVTVDGGTQASGGGSVTHEGGGFHSYAPTTAESNGDHIAFTFSGTGAISNTIQVYTFFPQTVDNATGIADIPTTSEFNARTLVASAYFDPAADAVAAVTTVTNQVTANVTAIASNVITAASIAASALDGKGDWNIGKSGYTLTQTFPSNFSSMVISGAGAVDGLVQGYLNSLLTEATAGRIAANFDTFFENADAVTTKVVDDVGSGGGGGTDWTTAERNEIRGRIGITGTTAAGGNTPTLAEASNLATVDGIVDAIKVDTTAILTDTGTTLPNQITGLNNVSAAQVNAEVLDVMVTDTFAEPSGVPAATASIVDKLGYVTAKTRNKSTQTATTFTLRNDADSGDISTNTVSDDGTTFTKGEDS